MIIIKKLMYLLLTVLLILICILTFTFFVKNIDNENEEVPEKIDGFVIQEVSKSDRIVIKSYDSEEIIGVLNNDNSIQLVIDLVTSATLRTALNEYIESLYVLDLYNGDDLIDSIELWPSLNEISFNNYKNDKRFDVDDECMKELNKYINFIK